MDLDFSDDLRAFQAEVRSFIETNLPDDLRDKVRRGLNLHRDDYVRWQSILAAKGWLAYGWPAEHGGPGWSPVQQYIFQEELGRAHTPRIVSFAIKMVGPVIYTFGTPEQKAFYLPRISGGIDWWCQGYSEPGAGSDLASLRTTAMRDGDPADAPLGAAGRTDYRSDVRTAPPGTAVRIAGGDDRIVLTRTTADEVIVLGYGGEPYLRLDADGVWENRNSPAVALNDERRPTGPLVGSEEAPDWVLRDSGDTAVYHDHRSHWMGTTAPVIVRENPDRVLRLYDWSLPLVVDGRTDAIAGDLTWMGRPRTGLWWLAAGVVALTGLAIGIVTGARWPIAAAGCGAAIALLSGIAVGVSRQLDEPNGGTGALVGIAVGLALGAVALVGVRLTGAVPAYAASVLLLVAIVAGSIQLLGSAGPAFGFALVPGPLPTLAVRGLILAGLLGVMLAVGACVRAWRDLLAPLGHAEARAVETGAW
ncbi:MAG: acyl-CoA dehydrogenase family protein [Planctomycetota bacterium]